MNLPRSVAIASLLFGAACATTADSGRPVHPFEFELRELQERQEVFRSQNTGQFVFDFPNHGRVTVREITLDGFPGHTYLRCRFHYQNRTAKPVMQAFVSLDVLDAQDHVVSTQSCHCVFPIAMAIGRGSYYSDELRTPTYSAHLEPGWKWRIRCHADLEEEDEPLDPPIEEPVYEPLPPMKIKDRSWPYPTPQR